MARHRSGVGVALATALCAASASAEPVSVRVEAKPHWNDGKVSVAEGQRLRIAATGTWTDWTITRGPEGFTKWYLKPFEGGRRIPKANWFALIGCVGQTLDHCFVVGRGGTFTAPATGRLWFFANDVERAHWNNKGHVDATVDVEPAAG